MCFYLDYEWNFCITIYGMAKICYNTRRILSGINETGEKAIFLLQTVRVWKWKKTTYSEIKRSAILIPRRVLVYACKFTEYTDANNQQFLFANSTVNPGSANYGNDRLSFKILRLFLFLFRLNVSQQTIAQSCNSLIYQRAKLVRYYTD